MACLGGGLCSPSDSSIVRNTQQTVYVTDIKTKIYTVFTKSAGKPNVIFAITLTTVDKFSSNLVDSCSN